MNTYTCIVFPLKRLRLVSINSIDSVESAGANQKSPFSEEFLYYSIDTIEKGNKNLPQHDLTPNETQLLQESINSNSKTVNIRLRQGEYQYDLAKQIASFQLELEFPNVKDLTKKLYGEKEASEARFIRKIQTVLKKMEKSDIVRILPKDKPWELQRYALSSFKFQDVDKNLIALATPQQIEQTQNLLNPLLSQSPKNIPTTKPSYAKTKILTLALIVVISYTAVLWALLQPIINLTIFMPAFYIAVACSLILGKLLSQK
jgi:hypothetical protein